MDKKEQIRRRLKALANPEFLITILATVVSVDEDAKTCVVDHDGVEYDDVRFLPVINDNQSVIAFPAIGAFVLAARIENYEGWMVIGADEISKYRITIGDMVFEMDGEKFLLKKGDENLKLLVDDLFAAMLAERHLTNTGVTINLTPDSITAYNNLKTRFDSFLKDS